MSDGTDYANRWGDAWCGAYRMRAGRSGRYLSSKEHRRMMKALQRMHLADERIKEIEDVKDLERNEEQ